jgi:hypothetical protein
MSCTPLVMILTPQTLGVGLDLVRIRLTRVCALSA